MIITLSEKRNEKLVFDWAEEMTERHAQDFCDVCNAVMSRQHFDVPYILERFGVNMYGKGFICTVHKDNRPLAALGGIADSMDGKTAFQLEFFVTMPEARKSGYNVDLIYGILDSVAERYPNALLYGFPNKTSCDINVAAGFAKTELYRRVFCGATEDFLQSMPYIDDDYAQTFTLKKKKAAILTVKGKCYAVFTFRLGKYLPAGVIVGEVNRKFKGTVPDASKLRVYTYCSREQGIFGKKRVVRVITYRLGAVNQDNNLIPDYYKSNHNSTDFFTGIFY